MARVEGVTQRTQLTQRAWWVPAGRACQSAQECDPATCDTLMTTGLVRAFRPPERRPGMRERVCLVLSGFCGSAVTNSLLRSMNGRVDLVDGARAPSPFGFFGGEQPTCLHKHVGGCVKEVCGV